MRLIVFLAVCSLMAQTSPPSPADLLDRAIALHKAQNDRGWRYTFREDHEDRQLDKSGTPGAASVRTYEHIMLEGSEFKRLVLVDGKPLDAKTQKKVDDDLAKARDDRWKRGPLTKTVSLGGLDVLERLFDNEVIGEETVLGRKAWRMESEPKAGFKPANKQEDEVLATRKMTWFDEQDGFAIQERDVSVRAANGWLPGSTVEFQYTKVGEEWLTSRVIIHADLKMMAVGHARVEAQQRYYDYKRFTVDSTLKPE